MNSSGKRFFCRSYEAVLLRLERDALPTRRRARRSACRESFSEQTLIDFMHSMLRIPLFRNAGPRSLRRKTELPGSNVKHCPCQGSSVIFGSRPNRPRKNALTFAKKPALTVIVISFSNKPPAFDCTLPFASMTFAVRVLLSFILVMV